MGTHRCLERAADLFRARTHILHVDIRRFFPSMNHSILRELLEPLTPPSWRWLRDVFLHTPTVIETANFYFPSDDLFTPITSVHGLPIGSLTSQIWANVYLSPIDHMLHSYLGLPSFVRYCDDMLVFANSASQLQTILVAIAQRAQTLRLQLNPLKTRLYRTTDPVAFLGFVLHHTQTGVSIQLRHENVVHMRRRMRLTQALFATDAIGMK